VNGARHGFTMDKSLFTQLAAELARRGRGEREGEPSSDGLQVLADIHTHPRRDVSSVADTCSLGDAQAVRGSPAAWHSDLSSRLGRKSPGARLDRPGQRCDGKRRLPVMPSRRPPHRLFRFSDMVSGWFGGTRPAEVE
jgi:hypothetical protein